MLEKIFTQTQFRQRFPQTQAWRQTAFNAFQTLPLPSPKEESWRYTDLNGIDFSSIAPVDDVKPQFESRQARVSAADPDERFGTPSDKISAWTQGFGNALEIDVPAATNARLESTISLHKSGALLQSVHVGAGAKLDFFEHYTSNDSFSMFGQKTVLHVAENAQLRYFAVQRFGQNTLSFAEKEFHLEDNTQLTCFHADVGSRLSRTVVDHHFDGTHAQVPEHTAVFFGSHHQHFDLSTHALHHGTDTKSDIVVKGALKDTASAVYRGLIRIDKNAKKTDSFLQDRVLHLNKGVKSNSIPSLYIDNNDVKASHGATVSKLNDESLFYLRSRGLSRPSSEKLVVEGFLDELVQRLPHEGLRRQLQSDVQNKIMKNMQNQPESQAPKTAIAKKGSGESENKMGENKPAA